MTKEEKITKAKKTKAMIIQKSAALFNQQGFAGTSIGDIMNATGLTKGGLYGNFKNKEEIAIAAFEYAVEATRKAISKRTHIIDNMPDKLKGVVYFYKENIFSPVVKGGCPILNTSVEADDNNPILREHVVSALDYWQKRILYTLKAGIERKEIKESIDQEAFAVLFISILEGGIMMSRIYKDQKYFDATSIQLIKMIEEIRL